MQMRCPGGKLFGELDTEGGLLEVKCRQPQCGAGRGVVVLHVFNASTGAHIRTERYREIQGED
jgi:hypothetical protein